MINVRQAEVVGRVFWVFGDLADRGGVLRPQAVGYAHFIEVGIADEGKQAAVLVLPAETADAVLPRRFQDGDFDGLAVNPSLAEVRLLLGDGLQRAVVNRFDEAVS